MDALPPDAGEYARDLDLPPRKQRGWVHELEVPMRGGDTIHYASDHDPPGGRVEFNVHSHEGKDVTYYARTAEAETAGTFTAPREGNFYLMWENVSGDPIHVRVRANRHEVHGGPVADAGHRHD